MKAENESMGAVMTKQKSTTDSKAKSATLWGTEALSVPQYNKIRLMLGLRPGHLNTQTLKPTVRSSKSLRVMSIKHALKLLSKWEAERLAARKAARAAKKAANSTMPPVVKQTTKMVFCLDNSGSIAMSRLTDQIEKLYAKNLATARAGVTTNHDLFVSVYYFNSDITRKHLNAPVHTLSSDLPGYFPMGGTRLYDCVQEVTNSIVSPHDDPKTTGYVVMVLTDGKDEGSHITAEMFRKLIAEKQGTDRWTFTFLLPPHDVNDFVRKTGVHAGNVMGWSDIEKAAEEQSVGIQTYMGVRAQGGQSVSTFYVNAPSAKDIAKLPTLTGAKIWNVDKEAVIKDFVESHNQVFAPGHSYYQLTKPESVQDYKKMVLTEKGSKEIKANVRDLLGLPTSGTVRVKPGNFANYDIFVESQSLNRKLVRGTRLIYLPV